MFRITERRDDSRVVLKLEGRLSAAVVPELDDCWRTARERRDGSPVSVDLTDVCLVDAAGQQQLARMHRGGVSFVTRGCFMRELVRELADIR